MFGSLYMLKQEQIEKAWSWSEQKDLYRGVIPPFWNFHSPDGLAETPAFQALNGASQFTCKTWKPGI